MSPEHMQGRVSRASDIFSLGMVLLHMITGRTPFGDMQVAHVVHGTVSGQLHPPWPSTYPLPELVDVSVQSCARLEF